MSYVIGVDCGGTKTEAVAYDQRGQQLTRRLTGFGNLLVEFDGALRHIKEAVQGILDELGPEACQEIVFGIAGIDSGGLKPILEGAFADWQRPIVLMNDGQLAHYGILHGQDGVMVVAGTGSVFLGRSEGEWYRVGGWGHLLGDGGSAYDIARKAIQQSLAEFDQGQAPSQLSSAVFEHFAVGDVLGLTKAVYSLEKGRIAEIASLVAAQAEHSHVAQAILASAGRELAMGVGQLARKMPGIETLTIGLNGGVIERNPQVRQAFFQGLATELPEQAYQVLTKEDSCAKGAYYYRRNGVK